MTDMKKEPPNPSTFPGYHNAHFQTIWPAIIRKKPLLQMISKRITLPDGDFIDINYIDSDLDNSIKESNRDIALLFHGLGGSINSTYSLALMRTLNNAGLKAIFIHFRGASGESNRKTISYHAGKTDDIAFVVDKIHRENPDKKLFAIGISIGGSALINYLGKHQINNPLSGAVAVSVPYLLLDAARSLNQGFARLYQRYLLKFQKQTLQKKFETMPCPIDLNSALNATSFYEFDDFATAPLHGFDGVLDYYIQCSAKQFLQHIKTPTLLIHAKDDPFMSGLSIPQQHELSKNVELELHETGGHAGFVMGRWPWRFEYYLDKRVPEFFLGIQNNV